MSEPKDCHKWQLPQMPSLPQMQMGGTQFIASEPVAAVALKCDPPERSAHQTCAQVMHKERGKEKGKSPYNPLKEKESQKEIYPSPYPSPYPRERACAGAQGEPSGKGKGQGKVDILDKSIEIRPSVTIHVNDEFIRNSEVDSVEMAMAILRLPKIETYKGMTFNNPRILRKIRSQIGDETFRELIIQQWHENAIDGEPRNRAAAFMAKLYAVRDEIRKERKGGEE